MTTGLTGQTYKVAVWATGGVGRFAIRTIADRPNLELVNAWVHSAQKDGGTGRRGRDRHRHESGAVNAIEAMCNAPSGLLAALDVPAAHIRGVMW